MLTHELAALGLVDGSAFIPDRSHYIAGEGPVDNRVAYDHAFQQTKQKVRAANAHIKRLEKDFELIQTSATASETAAGASSDPVACTGHSKHSVLTFLKMQHAANSHILDLLNKNHCAVNSSDINEEISEDARKQQDEFYIQASATLKMIRDAIEISLNAPLDLITRLSNRFQSIATEWQGVLGIIGLTGAGLTVGASYGIGVFGNLNLSTWLPIWISGAWGIHLAVASGLVGAAAFALAAVVVIAAIDAKRYFGQNEADDVVKVRRDLNQVVDRLKEKPLPIEELVELRNIYERAWVFPLSEPSCDDVCTICQDKFRLTTEVSSRGDDAGQEAVRAPGCHHDHFLHKSCLMKWTKESGSVKCTMCQQ